MKFSTVTLLASVLAGCSGPTGRDAQDGGDAGTGPDAGPPNQTPDAGRPDTGPNTGGITVTCTGPAAPVTVNQPVDVTCTIDAAGRSVRAPVWSVAPTDGTVLTDVGGGAAKFSLSTNLTGYRHPSGFTDTAFTVTAKVADATDPNIVATGSATVIVLGNLWAGDNNPTTGGIVAFASDGTCLGYAIGPASIKNVASLAVLQNGDILVTSRDGSGVIKVFDLQGAERPIAFAMQDANFNSLFGGRLDPAASWSDLRYPRQMALSSTNEIFVTGGGVSGKPGIAVYNPQTGALKQFIPTPVSQTSYIRVFDAIARREDGAIVAATTTEESLYLFDERTYQPKSSPVVLAISTWENITALHPMPNRELLMASYQTGGPTAVFLIGSSLQVVNKHSRSGEYEQSGLALHHNRILVPYSDRSSRGIVFRYTLTGATLNCVDNCAYPAQDAPWTVPSRFASSVGLAGIVKLRAP